MTVGQGGQGQQRQVEYQRENRQNPQEEFHQNMQSDYGIQPRFPERQGAHYVGNIGQRIAVGDQRTNTTLAWPGDDMDTSDVSVNIGSRLQRIRYNEQLAVASKVFIGNSCTDKRLFRQSWDKSGTGTKLACTVLCGSLLQAQLYPHFGIRSVLVLVPVLLKLCLNKPQ